MAAAQQAGAQAGSAPQVVTVTSTRDPVDKSYRKMIRGMERFEREHALAPQATLRFHLLPRTPGVNMQGITLRALGDHIAIPIPVAPDNTFTLPRNEQALREDAAVIANRKTTSMTWRARSSRPDCRPVRGAWATCGWNAWSAWRPVWCRTARRCSAGFRAR